MRRRAVVAGATVAIAAACVSTLSSVPALAAPAGSEVVWTTHPVCAQPAPGDAACLAVELVPRRVPAGTASPNTAGVARPAATLPPALAGPTKHGYNPGALAAAYQLHPRWPGAAQQVVAIVDACYPTNIAASLAGFERNYGIHTETPATFQTIHTTTGGDPQCTSLDRDGWATETALDVEAVRGVCRQCRILLVQTPSPSLVDLANGVDLAARYVWPGTQLRAKQISNSYGATERNPYLPKYFASHYNHPGVAVIAANGDDGWYGWDVVNDGYAPEGTSEIPASLNTVVGVGATSLRLRPNGARVSETVWNDNGPANSAGDARGSLGASGGGCSVIHAARLWQAAVPAYGDLRCGPGKRSSTDIAAVGDPQTGYDVYIAPSATMPQGRWKTLGGTSLAAPLIAGMWALAGGPGNVAYPAMSLYGHFKSRPWTLYDVRQGGNGLCGGASISQCAQRWQPNPNAYYSQRDFNDELVDCGFPLSGAPYAHSAQCRARPGYDGPSGVGTPNGVAAFRPLDPVARLDLPRRFTHGLAVTVSGGRSGDPFPGGRVVRYHFWWGDAHRTNSPSATATHTYAQPGTYRLRLFVTDNFGRVSAPLDVHITVH